MTVWVALAAIVVLSGLGWLAWKWPIGPIWDRYRHNDDRPLG